MAILVGQLIEILKQFDPPENGFRLIETLEAGMSPLSVVYQRDLEYEKLMNKSNEIQG